MTAQRPEDVMLMAAQPPEDVILMAAQRPEDLLLCHAVSTGPRRNNVNHKQVPRSLRSHQDDNVTGNHKG